MSRLSPDLGPQLFPSMETPSLMLFIFFFTLRRQISCNSWPTTSLNRCGPCCCHFIFSFFSILDSSKENPWQKHTTKAWVQHGPTTKIGNVCYEVSLRLFADVCLCATLSSFRLYHSLFSHYSGTIQSLFSHYSIVSRYSIFSHYSTIIQSLVYVTAGIIK